MDTLARTKVKDLLKMPAGADVLAKGWVRTKRGNKQIKFIALNDGSTINNIQVVADMSVFDEELMKRITTGASLKVTGKLVESVGQYTYGLVTIFQSLAMGTDIYAVGQSANDEHLRAESFQVSDETAYQVLSIGSTMSGANDIDDASLVQWGRAHII